MNLKKIASYGILFIESILFFVATILLILKFTILNISYVKNNLEKANYYENIYNEIKNEMSYYTNQSGFEDDILDDVFTIADVKKSVNNFLENMYKGTKTEINTEKMKEKFNEKINEYIKNNNFQEVNKKEISTFVDKMISIYNDEIKLMGYADKTSNYIPKINRYSEEIILISMLIVSALIVINKKVFKRKYLSVILYTSSFLIIFFQIFIKTRIDIKNLFIYSDTITNVAKSIINNIFNTSLIVSIIYLIIGLILSLKKTKKS